MGKHACGMGNILNLRLHASFRTIFLYLIKILVNMDKTNKADKPFLLVCCSVKFILFKSVRLSFVNEISCVSITLHFVHLSQNCYGNQAM